MSDKVSIVKCDKYDSKKVRVALLKSLENIGFSVEGLKGKKVLIKPNILGAFKPEKAVTTHPVVLEELCKILKEQHCDIIIGESSAMNTDQAFVKCGLSKLKKYTKIMNFEGEKKKFFNLGSGKLSRVPLPEILFNVDLVIDFAKLKTHALTKVTLCVKNLYGCVPGKLKEKYHKVLPGEKQFSRLLYGIWSKIKPQLNILDGIVGLEGEGPGAAGDPVKSEVLIMGDNSPAVDIIASELIGFKSKQIYTNKFSKIKRKEIDVIGNGKNVRLKFVKPKSSAVNWFIWINKFLPRPKIIFNKDKCKKCHICERKCPVKAITLKTDDGFPVCDHDKCILCLCCIEVCPYRVICLKDSWPKRFLMWVAKKVRKV